MICVKSMKEENFRQCLGLAHAFYGTATVGERGQIVIPAEARADMDMRPGDKLLIMKHPVHKGLTMFKLDAVREFLDDFQRNLDELEKQ